MTMNVNHTFDVACALHPRTRAEVTVTIANETAWSVHLAEDGGAGLRSDIVDSDHTRDGLDHWSPAAELDLTSREAALDLLAWLGEVGERAQAAGETVDKYRPAALRLFVYDQGYGNPYAPNLRHMH